ncbi:unnamed protein product [Diamesa tonsa]
MMMTIFAVVAIIILVAIAVFRFLSPGASSWGTWLRSNGEEKIGLSKSKLYNANGFIVHSGSEILLGSTGSFKRFDSVDHHTYDKEFVFGQTTLSTPPWTIDEKIPPQPLRPAPAPTPISKFREQSNPPPVSKQAISSAPVCIKSVPRPVPRKQMSAPAASCSIPLINPPESLQKFVKGMQSNTNPFMNGMLKFENIKTSFFSATTTSETEFKIENERATQSASNNPFLNEIDENVFDFNPKTIKSILEEKPDDGYEGDHDENYDNDPLKQLEERIQNLERQASGKRKTSISENNRFSPRASITKEVVYNTVDTPKSQIPIINTNITDKYVDSLHSESNDNITKGYRKHIRNRSFSENEASDLSIFAEHEHQKGPETPLIIPVNKSSNPFHQPHPHKRLHKTPSETYLEQYSMMKTTSTSPTSITYNNKFAQLSKHPSLTKILNSQPLFEPTESLHSLTIKRAMSSESVSSESSVIISDLQAEPPKTGNLCVALQYDKHNIAEDGCELLVSVLEAKDLIAPTDANDRIDSFVRIYLVPDDNTAQQTKVFKNSPQPSYQETFGFWITKENIKRSLWFHLYHTSPKAHTLIGETEMKLTEFKKPTTTWLQLTDSRNNSTNWGELMFSLSYLPTAERLTVVVVKARNLKLDRENGNSPADNKTTGLENVFVKVYLLKKDKKVSKKRTSTKRGEYNPTYNEAMLFSVPPYMLNSIQVRLTVVNVPTETVDSGRRKAVPFGHVIVGSGTDGKGLLHWHQMITSLRKPVAMFHPLRRCTNK